MKTKDDFVKRYTSGQPTKYDKKKHIGLLFDVFKEGKGVAAFFNAASIGKRTFYDWLEVHKEFKEAYEAAIYISQEIWEDYPKITPDFNFPYWSAIMRSRFGYGKTRVQIAKDAKPLDRIDAIWKGLEEGELSGQEATQLCSVVTTQNNILADQPQQNGELKQESDEELMVKVNAIQKVLDSAQKK